MDSTCPYCFSSFPDALNVHISSHFNNVCHMCLYCKSTFKHHSILMAHVKKHHNTHNIFKCNFCEETFVRMYQCNKHVLNTHHIYRRIYKCHICDNITFTRRDSLTRHYTSKHKSLFLKEIEQRNKIKQCYYDTQHSKDIIQTTCSEEILSRLIDYSTYYKNKQLTLKDKKNKQLVLKDNNQNMQYTINSLNNEQKLILISSML